jgi:hypothetical protein
MKDKMKNLTEGEVIIKDGKHEMRNEPILIESPEEKFLSPRHRWKIILRKLRGPSPRANYASVTYLSKFLATDPEVRVRF